MEKYLEAEDPFSSGFFFVWIAALGECMGNAWRLPIYEKGRFGYWVGVISASVMVNQLTIYFFIAKIAVLPYGICTCIAPVSVQVLPRM